MVKHWEFAGQLTHTPDQILFKKDLFREDLAVWRGPVQRGSVWRGPVESELIQRRSVGSPQKIDNTDMLHHHAYRFLAW